MRIAREPALGIGNAAQAEQLEMRARAGAPVDAAMQQQDLADLLLDRVQRIERRHRLLEDDGDVVAAHLRGSRSSGSASSSLPLKCIVPEGWLAAG